MHTEDMTHEQRKLFAEGLVNLANIGAGAMVFGQLISGALVDFGLVALGLIVTFALYFVAFRFSRHRDTA